MGYFCIVVVCIKVAMKNYSFVISGNLQAIHMNETSKPWSDILWFPPLLRTYFYCILLLAVYLLNQIVILNAIEPTCTQSRIAMNKSVDSEKNKSSHVSRRTIVVKEPFVVVVAMLKHHVGRVDNGKKYRIVESVKTTSMLNDSTEVICKNKALLETWK